MQLTTIEDLSARVEDALKGAVTGRDMPFYEMMTYHMGWTGDPGEPSPGRSGLRSLGTLCLLACRAAGGDAMLALPAAASVELVISFCEIHADVQAGAPMRGNRDTVWWKWGPAQAINAGDGMHALARLALFGLQDAGLSAEDTFRAVQILDEASLRTCEGRFLDLQAQDRLDLGLDDYLEMARLKSGSLAACAARLGALAASADTQVSDALAACGESMGVAWQLSEDVRLFWDLSEDGSNPYPEVSNKMKLLPVVYAFANANPNQKRRLGEFYFKRVLEPDDVIRLRDLVDEMAVREACEGLIGRHRGDAAQALAAAPDVSDDDRAAIGALSDELSR